jgi:hypothetical protein
MGGYEFGAPAEEAVRLVDLLVGDCAVEGQQHDVRVVLDHVDPHGAHLVPDLLGGHHVGPLAGALLRHEAGRGHGRGEDVLDAHVEAHAPELLVVVGAGGGRVVGQEDERYPPGLERGYELHGPGDQVPALVDGAVHVYHESAVPHLYSSAMILMVRASSALEFLL